MSETDAGQGLFTTVHWKTLSPRASPVTLVLANNEFVITPEPDVNDHDPTPNAGGVAPKVAFGLERQTVMFEPALETEGSALTLIVMIPAEEGHEPLDIVQSKTLSPTFNEVIVVVGEFGLVINPLPKSKFQTPVPTIGVVPTTSAVVVVAQSV